ncbi:hypothetical protein LSTR_LSTR000083 [Laodelphax striatellus]|uniref:RNA helicase n=1 Tax=Laodelphax striatellus TaxID=195883 RepID=A0A482X659_LAOST|nr:hypothetical protein LSTR_LSTR000083 [Laodelphax striatellus]
MMKLCQFGIPSSLSQRVSNYFKLSRNNLQSPVLPKLLQHDIRIYCLSGSSGNEKNMEKLVAHIERLKSSLDVDKNKLIVPNFSSVRKIGGVRSRRNESAFECSLNVNIPSLISFRALGKGLTKELAKKSAINVFIRTTSFYTSKSITKSSIDNDILTPSSSRSSLNSKHDYCAVGVNVLKDLRRQYSHCATETKESEKQKPVSAIDLETHHSGEEADARKNEEKIIHSIDSEIDQKLYRDLLKVYPAPRNRLQNFFDTLEKSSKKKLLRTSSRLNKAKQWEYKYSLEWPKSAEFIGVSSSKKESAKKSALLALKWLKDMGKIDSKGNLFTVNPKEFRRQELNKPLASISLNKEYIEETESLVEEYDNVFAEQLQEICSQWDNTDRPSYFDTGVAKFDQFEASKTFLERRNKDLLAALEKRKTLPSRSLPLPITDYGARIVDLVRNNQVVVIKGEPGCGKSTQVPQLIFDDYTERLEGTECNIVVTQPRKISAMSIAERIAHERYEELGDVIGYQVRFASKLPQFNDGNILFCTLGIMLRKLLSPDGLYGVTHLIIDEAHERDLNTDILLLLAKRAIASNPDLRIVIMSATINPELFQNYFNGAPSILVPGFTHPVSSNFLDSNMERTLRLTGAEIKKGLEQPGGDNKIITKMVTKMVNWIDDNRPPGAILVFLPGWDTIRKVRDELDAYSDLFVVPVHSRLSHDDQRKIFMQPPRGKRKVVLATNIAETSITINDVIYVIDSGLLKEKRLNSTDGLSCLDNQWASRASVIQRKGRAGRVQPGECFHLYTREKFDSLEEFPMPEVHRIRLEMVVLQSKTYSGHEKAEEFLSQLPEPPKVQVIREAVRTLQFIGALDEDENLTPLGHRISIFTTHPLISKALVHAYFFKCVNPLVTIGTILSSEMELFPGMAFDKSPIREGKARFSPSSDHIAMTWLFHQWAEYLQTDDYRAERLMEEMLGSHKSFLFVKRLQELVADHLRQCELVPKTSLLFAKKADCNAYAFNDELIKGVLLSGVGNLLIHREYQLRKGVLKKTPSLVTMEGHTALIAGESVNYKRSEFPSPLLTYFQEMHSAQNRIAMIRETSIVAPLTVALFQPGTLTVVKPLGQDMDATNNVTLQLKSKKPLNFICDERTATAVVKLREAMWNVIDYFVMECGNPSNTKLYSDVSGFHNEVLSLLHRMLMEVGTNIDYDENGNLRKFVGKTR